MKNLTTLIVCIAVIILIIGILPVHGETDVYEKVFRLHILANSDSDEDQALKLKVRDAIIEETKVLFEDCNDREEAVRTAHESIEALENVAKKVILEEGYNYDVSVEICKERYPTKSYESLCFPTGEYYSLRVMIGDAKGQNWWCVLFPPLCLSAATEKTEAEDAFIAVGFTDDQYRIITESDNNEYEVRFKILEALKELERKAEKE